MAWYIVGPDKTGLDCSNCCAAFYESYGSCSIKSCSISGSRVFRNYVCPSTAFPTPLHYYKINTSTGDVTIEPNPRLCSTVSPSCYTYTPNTGLNAGGRVGSGCSSQTYVTSSNNCYGSQESCEEGCDTECGYAPEGSVYYPKSCLPNPSGACSCESLSSFSSCACTCVSGPFDGNCQQSSDPTSSCYVSSPGPDCTLCPDGTYACGDEECCGGAGYPTVPCTDCQEYSCSDAGYICVDKVCFPECTRPGYSCVCGSCRCNTSSTCCIDYSAGWLFDSSTRTCASCGLGYNDSSSGCCDTNWKRKGCDTGSICCNDGRCYEEATTLCVVV